MDRSLRTDPRPRAPSGVLAGRLEALPDLTDACENLEIAQPALGASEGTTEVPVTGRVGAEAASDDDLVAS